MNQLRHGSEIIEQLIEKDGLLVVGAEYSLESGEVDFFEHSGILCGRSPGHAGRSQQARLRSGLRKRAMVISHGGGALLRWRGRRVLSRPRISAPVAQLDRVSASEAEGPAFESRRARQIHEGPFRTHEGPRRRRRPDRAARRSIPRRRQYVNSTIRRVQQRTVDARSGSRVVGSGRGSRFAR